MTLMVIRLDAPGFCGCGCGTRPPIATRTDSKWRRFRGQPLPYVPGHAQRKSPIDFVEDLATHCWNWCRHRIPRGYATGDGEPAYRTVYKELVGPIPEGLELDHLCRNPACVNPGHLEPVTHQENMARAGIYRRKSHCHQGHPLTEGNLYHRSDGGRICRTCALERAKRNKQLRRAAA